MRKTGFFKCIFAYALILSLAIPFQAITQESEENAAAQSNESFFSPEELDQMLAPIALYPDALLAQVLTAATYPVEIVTADRFAKANQGLKGEALLEAAKDKDWAPSVKAMLEFPDLLSMMDEQLEWTTSLGDAFLAQQSDVMDSIQRLRRKAYEQGNLATTEEEVVKIEPQTQVIVIEPASTEIVYVPVYDSAVIYGDWWYPDYPPYYFYPRRYFGTVFLAAFFIGPAWGAWHCDWHRRDIIIDRERHNHFTRNYYGRPDRYHLDGDGRKDKAWTHDPRHRNGEAYRDPATARRFDGQYRPRSDERAKPAVSGEYKRTGTQPSKTDLKDLSAAEKQAIKGSSGSDFRHETGERKDEKTVKIDSVGSGFSRENTKPAKGGSGYIPDAADRAGISRSNAVRGVAKDHATVPPEMKNIKGAAISQKITQPLKGDSKNMPAAVKQIRERLSRVDLKFEPGSRKSANPPAVNTKTTRGNGSALQSGRINLKQAFSGLGAYRAGGLRGGR